MCQLVQDLCFWKKWEARGVDQWVLRVLKEGYPIPFRENPPWVSMPIALTAYSVGSKRFSALTEEMSALLTKRAVELVGDVNTPGFYNHLFCGLQVIWGMETCLGHQCPECLHSDDKIQGGNKSVSPLVYPTGRLDVTISMEDACFHIPVHPDSRKCLLPQICVPGQIFPILSSVFQPLYSSLSLHPHFRPSREVASPHGNQFIPLSR